MAGNGFVDFNAQLKTQTQKTKTQLISFDWSNNSGTVDVKIDGSVLEEKSSFKMLALSFFPKLDWGSTLSLLPQKKLEP